jgi:hypothetical protein
VIAGRITAGRGGLDIVEAIERHLRDDPHELLGVTESSRAGELLGYYARCSCGTHLDHEATRADAVLAHTRHALEWS